MRTWNLELGTWNVRRSRRRGIVLLLVVSLLALFVLLGATFTLVALQALQASKLELKQQQVGDPPDTEMDLVLGQILYDTQARTVLQYHSLLRDLYGYDAALTWNGGNNPQFRETFEGLITDVSTATAGNGPSAGGQLFTFTFQLPPSPLTSLSAIPNYYAGRVITFRGPGPAGNHSTRIVASTTLIPAPNLSGSSPVFATGQFTIEAIESKLAGSLSPSLNDKFVINGAPFNGTGAGYYYNAASATDPDPISGLERNYGINATYAAPDYTGLTGNVATPPNLLAKLSSALLPNYAAYDPNATYFDGSAAGFGIDVGGLDESWDAPDFQNMYLAMVPPRAAESFYDPVAANNLPIIPSFHRPELVNFWFNNYPADRNLQTVMPLVLGSNNYTNPVTPGSLAFLNNSNMHAAAQPYRDFARTFIMRPMPWDHPNFTGSNPYLTPVWGPATNGSPIMNMAQLWNVLRGIDPTGSSSNYFPGWDVDNDGDGIPDSIWLDPGMPVVTAPDGRRYKRLAAILIKDLDGSINLNAHGNLSQIADARYRAEYVPGTPTLAMLPPPGIATAYTPPPSPNSFTFPLATPVTLTPPNVFGLTPNLVTLNASLTAANPTGNYNFAIPRGMGFGPAEVDFLSILTTTRPAYTDSAALASYNSLLRNRYLSNYETLATAVPGNPSALTTTTGADYRDPLSCVKLFGVPNDYANTAGGGTGIAFANWYQQPSWYASPPDVWGRGAVVLDVGGQPLYAYMGQGPQVVGGTQIPGEVVDCPYEMRLSGEQNGVDTPYTAADLERVLRYHDSDAPQLSPRIFGAANVGGLNPFAIDLPGVIGVSQHRRNMVTTISSDIPTPATAIPPDWRYMLATNPNFGKIPGASSILDLYAARLFLGIAATNASLTPPQVLSLMQFELLKIVPWEFFKGQKFDINRQFGDGLDGNGNGTRDDPVESTIGERAFPGGNVNVLPNLPATFQNSYAQLTNGVSFVSGGPGPGSFTYPNDNLYTRQLYARHLFCLALLMLPPDFVNGTMSSFPPPGAQSPDTNITTNTVLYQQAMIRRIAQWAVNCVDYRDSDNVMTPFEFDYNPWDGWQVDGNLATDGTNQPESVRMNGTLTNVYTAQRGVVWGMEAPEVVISETLAFHDRGLKDTNQASSNSNGMNPDTKMTDTMNPDTDLDQFRVPKGSLFVELYCPRATQWATGGELGNNKPLATGAVNLSQVAPAGTSATNNYRRPVWRLAFGRLTGPGSGSTNPNPATVAVANPESMSVEPTTYTGTTWKANTSLLTGITTSQLTIDRFAYFANVYTSTANGNVNVLPPADISASFWNMNAGNPTTQQIQLQPGAYAVVAPRPLTYIGSQDPNNASPVPPAGSLWGGNSKQYIYVQPAATSVLDINGTSNSRTVGTDIRQPLGIICSAPNPLYASGDAEAWNPGMNISEPLPHSMTSGSLVPSGLYYPSGTGITFKPSDTTTTTLAAGPGARATNADFYDDPDLSSRRFKPSALEGMGGSTNYPLAREQMNLTGSAIGTFTDCSSALLQRLANPNLPYNPQPYDALGNLDPQFDNTLVDVSGNIIINPYITVDWQTIDLTVFNGEENMKNSTYPEIRYTNGAIQMNFRSRQRGNLIGGSTPFNGTYLSGNPWPPLSRNDATATWETTFNSTAGGGATYFDCSLSNNLTDPSVDTPPYNRYNSGTGYTFSIGSDRQSLGFINATVDFPIKTTASNLYFGEPITPFPWLNWNNRPFTNAMEMLAVPASSASRYFLEMTPGFMQATVTLPPPLGTQVSPYPGLALSPNGAGSTHTGFGQLINFFQTAQYNPAAAANTWASNLGAAPHFYRLLDYVEAPSPFLGTERWYNPQFFGGLNTGTTPNTFTSASAPLNVFYRPPFNKLSRFRDPGKVNVNTIFDFGFPVAGEVWDAAVGQFPGLRFIDGFWTQLMLSRQGQPPGSTVLGGNPNYPTWFANPFRAADSADLMPTVGTPNMRKLNPVEATLLRQDPSLITPTGPVPLFQMNTNNNQYANWVGNTPGSSSTYYVGQYHDVNRNPYFAFQPYQKIGNLLTTRSNCFAVWITIGYFEVEEYRANMNLPASATNPIIFDTAHPDGYALAQEIGYDSGNVTRHRSFFIIDRSIPVGFIPGSRLNTDDCVLVKRLIE